MPIESHDGAVLQIAGDAISAAFGATMPSASGAAAGAAVRAALEMGELMAQFNAERAATGRAPVGLGIGIASGEVVAGYTGTSQRTAYVCVGAAVERAARLEALAGGAAGAVLIDGATHARPCRAACRPTPCRRPCCPAARPRYRCMR